MRTLNRTTIPESNLFTSTVKKIKTNWHSQLGAATMVLGMAAFPIACAAPAFALEVEVSPQQPRLGDTISVVIGLEKQTPGGNITVTSGKETFKAFEIAPNKYRAFVPTTPLEKPGTRTLSVNAGSETKNVSVPVANRQFRVQRINLPPGKAGVRATELELRRAREFRATVTSDKLWNGAFVNPSKGRKSTPYGVRRYYNGVFANDYYHRGLDYAAPTGSPVVAPAPGRVILVGKVSQGFRVHGNTVGIDHGQGVSSILMHLNSINVKEGDVVQAGQKIGTVGSTGASTGPHLHWGLYVNGKCIDPVPWLNTGLE